MTDETSPARDDKRTSTGRTSKKRKLLVGAATTVMTTLLAVFFAEARDLPRDLGHFDIRILGTGKVAAVQAAYPVLRQGGPVKADRTTALSKLKAKAPGAEVTFSRLTGSAEVVRSSRGTLKSAVGEDPVETVFAFLREHAGVYGLSAEQVDALEVVAVSRGTGRSLQMVRLRQTVGGVPIFQSETRVLLDPKGRIVRTVGRLVPGIDEARVPPLGDGLISAPEALGVALASVGVRKSAAQMSPGRTLKDGRAVLVEVAGEEVPGGVHSERLYFPLGPGVLVPAWSQIIFMPGAAADWYTVVDGHGTLLYRKNIRSNDARASAPAKAPTEEARFGVYVQADGTTPADNPAPQSPSPVQPGEGTQFPAIDRTIVRMSDVQNLAANPDGWLPDGARTTTGGNVMAFLDRDGNDSPDEGTLDADGQPVGLVDTAGNERDFIYDFNPPPLGSDPDQGDDPEDEGVQRGSVTNLFYNSNWYHDRLFEYGFDKGSGNFQDEDPVLAMAQWRAGRGGRNGSNFATPPDGQSGMMRMFVFSFPGPERDGSLDNNVVNHELTHGLTNRLIGNGSGLNWFAGAGMGEGWSDFYEMSLLNDFNTDDPDGNYASGPYVTYLFQPGPVRDNYVYGIRRFPYTTDNSVNPLTWADVDDSTADMSGGIPPNPLGLEGLGGNEVHNSGEVWALSLWEVRSRIIAQSGGDVPTGNDTMLQITTDALKLTPIDPSFEEARDALFDADCAVFDCAHEMAIWEGFADRGLGYGASASGKYTFHHGVKESFDIPNLVPGGVLVDDTLGNGNGFIDPGDTADLLVTLRNPWRNAAMVAHSAVATLTCTNPAVTVVNGVSSYGTIGAQGHAVGGPLTVSVASFATCGASLGCSVTIESSLGSTTADLGLRFGEAVGPGDPMVFTRETGGLAIPDSPFTNVAIPVVDTFSLQEDYEIADLDFRLDFLQHPAVGDLAVVLKAPNGVATDLIYRLSGGFDQLGFNNGGSFVNTVIDDEASGDLLIEPSFSAPFPGSWPPVLNSPEWDFPDPQGQLSRYDGQSTRGDWTLVVTDNASGPGDPFTGESVNGTIHNWSLIVRPMEYSCGGEGAGNILLSDDRFLVSVTRAENGATVPAYASALKTSVTGLYYFFKPENLELLVKVLDGCDINGHFWVFFAGATTVEFTVTVTDTQTGMVKEYVNPAGHPADAVTDTSAFATCP